MNTSIHTPPLVSILVPVYNAQQYLGACLDSILNQSLTDLEVVAINDGSTDASLEILQSYATQDERIRIISKENTGYGDTMNCGIDAAHGRYIGIVESDDIATRPMFQTLCKAAELYSCDVVKSNYFEFTGDYRGEFHVIYGSFDYWQPFDPHDDPRIMLVRPAHWTAVYRRDWLIAQGIRFTPSPGAAFQDISFNHQALIAARRIKLLRRPLYRYRVDNEASSFKSDAKVLAVCEEYDHVFEFLRARGEDDLHLFGPWLNFAHFDTALWNYNRISNDAHETFIARWTEHLRQMNDENLIDPTIMPLLYQQHLDVLLNDPDAFCEMYPDTVPRAPFI